MGNGEWDERHSPFPVPIPLLGDEPAGGRACLESSAHLRV
jgi:hypothetical protein